MADILASVSVVLGAEVSGFKAAMADARKELRGLVQFAEQLKSVGESLTKYVTLPIVAVGGAAVKLAGDMEVAKVAFTTMLGSAEAATQTLGELKQFAADTPFEFPEIQEAAKKLLAFNTPAKDLKETLRQLGDISAGIGAPIGEIAELYGKARVQGRLFQEDINQLTGRGIPIIQELAKQFGVTDGEVRKLVESGKVNFGNLQTAFADLTKEGAKFGGLMAAQSQTLPGLISTFTDTIGQELAGLGQDITESLNLKDALASVSAFIKSVGDGFRSLSPEVKKFIIVGAGIAAAIGPVLLAVGALGAALPAIIAGFTLLSGPIGIAVAAFVALGVGIAAVASGGRDLNKEFEDQKTKVAGLEKNITPLLSRYDELKGKTSLNTAEQAELKSIINQVADQVPSAATAFDSYGNALDINSGKVRAFVKENQAALRGLNGEKIAEQNSKLRDLASQIIETQRLLNDPFKTVTSSEEVSDGKFRLIKEQVKLTDEEMGRLRATLKKLNLDFEDGNAALRRLKGELLETGEASDSSGGKIAALSDKAAKALAALEKALLDNANASRALGPLYDYIGGRAKVLESGVKSLTDAGFAPGGKVVQGYVAQLRAIPQALDQINSRITKGLEKAEEAPPLKLKLEADYGGSLDFANGRNPLNLPGRLAPIDSSAFVSSLKPVTQAMVDAQRVGEKLSADLGPALQQGLAGAAAAFGQAVGDISTGAAGIEAIPQALLGALGGLAVQVGELAIATGIAVGGIKAALQSLNPALAIAGGIALVALGSAVSSAASSIGGGGGAGRANTGSFSQSGFGNRTTQGGTQKIEVTVVGTLKAAGSDLKAALKTTDYRNLRTS